jgi:phosphatidylinositol-bisphosphatase
MSKVFSDTHTKMESIPLALDSFIQKKFNSYLIWCGDLNYRINLSESVIKSRLRQNKLDLLCEYDQLIIERSAGRTFPMFEEGEIAFEPTYKYDAGTDRYDTR